MWSSNTRKHGMFSADQLERYQLFIFNKPLFDRETFFPIPSFSFDDFPEIRASLHQAVHSLLVYYM